MTYRDVDNDGAGGGEGVHHEIHRHQAKAFYAVVGLQEDSVRLEINVRRDPPLADLKVWHYTSATHTTRSCGRVPVILRAKHRVVLDDMRRGAFIQHGGAGADSSRPSAPNAERRLFCRPAANGIACVGVAHEITP
ncbi:hypothetical protein OPT61_g4541 [Boeremia exigua]|uniref:Uncharacterized protein n=1 Tax=Boeremia exigua TaxID=749465 RepID=A0ACC2IDR3_9PLEO|nr:hypothetical protein OPT61_g4541 [Boeremia exigua]